MAFRIADSPESVAGQGVARNAGAVRRACPAFFFERQTGLSRSGNRANLLFFLPISGI